MIGFLFVCSDALGKALSALYAKLLVVLGLAFPVTEVIATGVPDGYYQVQTTYKLYITVPTAKKNTNNNSYFTGFLFIFIYSISIVCNI